MHGSSWAPRLSEAMSCPLSRRVSVACDEAYRSGRVQCRDVRLFTDSTRVLSIVSAHASEPMERLATLLPTIGPVGCWRSVEISSGSQGLSAIQGYLAHKKTSPHRTLQ